MKKMKNMISKSLIGFMILSGLLNVQCKKKDPEDPESPQKGKVVLSGEITGTRTLSSDTVYTIQGFVYVIDGATLRIPAGTVLKGDKSTKGTLIIERGGKIYAQGTQSKPVVFTSDQPKGQRSYGDWGGIIICGKARVNTASGESKIEGGPRSFFGGTNNSDNSGIMTYCRLEFCGVEYQTDNEINGLTMGGVGSGTQIDHIQVSYCGDDSFEWFGGSVNCKYLVAYRGWDDEFDTDNGFSGKLQFLVGLRDWNVADKSKSNGFESDNDANGSNNSPYTSPVFSNVTLFGPYLTLADTSKVPTGGNGDFQAAMHLRRNTQLKVYNSVFAGWPFGLFIENGGKGDAQGNATNGSLVVKSCVLAGMQRNFQEDSQGTANFNQNYYNQSGLSNTIKRTVEELEYNSISIQARPNFTLKSGSPLLSGASFSDANLSGFENVNFIGAFGTTDWTAGWCNFDPQNTDY